MVALKASHGEAGLQGWLKSHLNLTTNIILDTFDSKILDAVSAYLQKEECRKQRSASFRSKRLVTQQKWRDTKSVWKNKNRQDAARKRVRDPNGKF